MQLLSITCLDLCSLDVSGNLQISDATLHAFLDSVDVAPDRQIDLYIGGNIFVIYRTFKTSRFKYLEIETYR